LATTLWTESELLNSADGQLGSELKTSPDFYSSSNSRDLALHVSERCLTLREIEHFLNESGLEFRGFNLDKRIVGIFQERFPQEGLAGKPAKMG
jgi:hypothetical protein